ncbi:MAG TPA: Uma2 family endonuclease [Acidobacteriaceae bacterium]|nr:Uma2 family endonuclease [Acidobacteriaceae bacterium]
MSAVPQPVRISVEEYLSTSYRPDCDYVDGRVEERNLGTFDHAYIHGLLVQLFLNRMGEWQCLALPEQRVRVGGGRFRIPDVCVVRRSAPREPIIGHASLLCIEILSPEDRMSRIRERVEDYFILGTENVWVVDPELRKGYVCSRRGFQEPENGVLEIPERRSA